VFSSEVDPGSRQENNAVQTNQNRGSEQRELRVRTQNSGQNLKLCRDFAIFRAVAAAMLPAKVAKFSPVYRG
jgi:hypothetical protein